jgi:sugar lactone lactonase YvrE
MVLCVLPQLLHAQTITTFAGCGIGNDSMATRAELVLPNGVALDRAGNTYIADYYNNVVRKVSPSGIITNFAGSGVFGYNGDGGPATAAHFRYPNGVAVDTAGNVYIADRENSAIRMVDKTGIISTVAGTGTLGYNGDGIPAISAKLNYPTDVAVDTSGNIYIADEDNYRVRMVNAAGTIYTIAGNGIYGFAGMGGPASAATIGYPYRVALDKAGNLYIGDVHTHEIYKVNTGDTITTFAGNGTYGYTGDSGPATAAELSYPDGLVADTAGNIWFSDRNNSCIRMVSAATGIINTMYGSGIPGYSGDGGPATDAELNTPQGLAFDTSGNLYICDYYSNRIRMVNTSGIISTFAGQSGLFEEGVAATNAEFSYMQNITTDAAGNVYVADMDNQRIRMINATSGVVTTLAGGGISGQEDPFGGDGGPATAAHLYFPCAMAFDGSGNLYICDQDNQRVRMVNPAGTITTFAGNGTFGFVDNVDATGAEFRYPTGVAVDHAGNVYIVDNGNYRVRKVDAGTGIISTIAGNGTSGYSGDGGPATSAELKNPLDVGVDGAGNVYISDGNYCIRMVDAAGNISTVAGNGTAGFSGDGGPAVDAQMATPWGIKVDNGGDIFIADDDNQRIRLVQANGIISTIAGNGTAGFSGDGGSALSASLNFPKGIAYDNAGNLYIADENNYRVRKTNIPASLAVPTVNKATPAIFAFPNPTVGIVYLMNAANSNAAVYDVLGKQVLQQPITTNKQTMDLSALASGVYLLQVTSDNGVQKMMKVVKE